jgi:hypothetical protein
MKISNRLLDRKKDSRIQLEMLDSLLPVDIHRIFNSKLN